MRSHPLDPPESLKVGRRALDGIREFTLLDDLTWDPNVGFWLLHGSITVDVNANDFVLPSTDWYVKMSPEYPWGSVIFYPAVHGGLRHTFPHQNYNGGDPGDSLWRQGRLCVDTSVRVLGRPAYDIEPYGAHERLAWHARRAVEWLRAASAGELSRTGDPFELPDFRPTGPTTLAFNETRESLSTWDTVPDRTGLADLGWVPAATGTGYVRAFRTLKGDPILDLRWGSFLAGSTEAQPAALWIRLDETPVLEPWQAPMTWGELRAAVRRQDLDLDRLIRQGAERIRDGERHALLLGFPIPETVGGPPVRMHWLATQLPPLTVKNPPGFRPTNDRGRWKQDRDCLLRNTVPIKWLTTENWSPEEFSGRGKLSPALTDRKVTLIGAGALGSVIGELLVRAGVNSISVCDGDNLHAGNLARHTLSLESVGVNKAEALGGKLTSSSPFATVSSIGRGLTANPEDAESWLTSSDLVIDCTGSDEALSRLERVECHDLTVFVSISLGMFARRVFIFCSAGVRFPHDEYISAISPWLGKEAEEHSGTELPREGIGCWHPLFPARIDDIWMMGSAAVKAIEEIIASQTEEPTLSVLEQVYKDGRFTGLRTALLP